MEICAFRQVEFIDGNIVGALAMSLHFILSEAVMAVILVRSLTSLTTQLLPPKIFVIFS